MIGSAAPGVVSQFNLSEEDEFSGEQEKEMEEEEVEEKEEE